MILYSLDFTDNLYMHPLSIEILNVMIQNTIIMVSELLSGSKVRIAKCESLYDKNDSYLTSFTIAKRPPHW